MSIWQGVGLCLLELRAAAGWGPLELRLCSPTETLSKPIIWAEPSEVVEKGSLVTIWCQGAVDTEEFQLYLEGTLFTLERPKPPGLRYRVHVLIPAMSSHTAGQCSCGYQSGENWTGAQRRPGPGGDR